MYHSRGTYRRAATVTLLTYVELYGIRPEGSKTGGSNNVVLVVLTTTLMLCKGISNTVLDISGDDQHVKLTLGCYV